MKDLDEILSKIEYKDVQSDSRKVKKGDIFVAVHGFFVDHSEFIPDAVEKGASLVVGDIDCDIEVPYYKTDDVDKVLVYLCKKVYNYDNQLQMVGITGTDGKTTTATILARLFNKFIPTAYMGTNGLVYNNKHTKTDNTTPSTEDLYRYFSKLNNEGCKNLVMEVSSEALLHNRVASFLYKYAVFTNITQDHLNIHKTLENYIESKLKLMNYLEKDGVILINKDDDNCKKIVSKNHQIYSYGQDETSDFKISNIKFDKKYTTFTISHDDKDYQIKSPYPFLYNVYNLTIAFVVCFLEGFDLKKVIDYIEKLDTIPGRSESIDYNQDYKLILDYAHTENAIKNLVEEVKKYNKRIIVVTGAAGGREKEKRERIGDYLLNNTDLVVFTMDDPRWESVDDIIDQMIGKSTKTNYERFPDRVEAIEYALDIAKKDDYVLIIGKGRDDYMAIGDKKLPYCDYDVIKKYFKKKYFKKKGIDIE